MFIFTTILPVIPLWNTSNLNNENIILEQQEASAYYISANWINQPVIVDGNITSLQEWSDATVLNLWSPKYSLNATLYFKNNATHLAILCDAYGDETQDTVGPALDQLDHLDMGFDTGNDDTQTDAQEDSFSLLANGTVLQWEYNSTASDYSQVALDNVAGGVTFTASALNTNNHEIYEFLISLNTIYANAGEKVGLTSPFINLLTLGWPYDSAGQFNTYPLTATYSDLTSWGTLKLAEQSPTATITGLGDNLTVQFHCENNGTTSGRTESSDFNVSIPSGNWNQNWVDIDLTNIYAPNDTDQIEDASASSVFEELSPAHAQSFRVNASCLLQNFTVQLWPSTDSDDPEDILVRVYPAIDSSGTPKPAGSLLTGWLFSQAIELTETPGWTYLTFNTSDLFLNISATYDKTFFIMLFEDPGSFQNAVIYWKKWNDPSVGISNDSKDEAYLWESSGTNWAAVTSAFDMDMKVAIAPLSNTPLPSQVGIKINGSIVTDNGIGQGKWNSSQIFTGSNVLFDVQSNWTITYDVDWGTSYELTGVGTVDYQAGLAALVDWNVTTSITFPTTFHSLEINMSIPLDWNASSPTVLNGSSLPALGTYLPANYIWYPSQGIVQIKNMSEPLNYWRLDCAGYNYLTGVSLEKRVGLSYVGISLGETVNITDTLRINGTVEDNLGNPITELNSGNLTVYTASRTAHTENNVDVTSGILSFTDWLISMDTDELGVYTIRLIWFNGLEVGLNETTIQVVIPTDAIKIMPTEQYFFIGAGVNEINVTILYNCTYWAQRGGISNVNASFRVWNYSTMWWDWTNLDQEAVEFGYYNYTFDYSSWTNGTYTVQINLNKTGYQSQEINYTVFLVFNTGIELVAPPSNQITYDYPDNLTIQVNYTKATGEEILTASVLLTINGSAPLALSVVSDLYVIQLNSTDYGVGFYNITITASLLGYFTQQININWTIQAATTNYILFVNGTYVLVGDFWDFHYNDVMNISIFYNDTVHGVPITGAPLNLTLLGVGIQAITNQANGWYNWIINTSTRSAGLWNFSLSVEKSNYQNHTQTIEIYTRYNTTLAWIRAPPTSARPGDTLGGTVNPIEVNFTRFGIPVAGQNITFRITTDNEVYNYSVNTAANGSAKFNEEYIIKSDVTTLNIEIIYNGNTTYFSSLRSYSITIIPGGILEQYWWVFILLVALVAVVAMVVRSRRKARVAKEAAKQEILTSFQDVTKILHLVVIHKGTGADIFDYKIQERLDPTLLAGFIQAVKEFGKQLDQEGQ